MTWLNVLDTGLTLLFFASGAGVAILVATHITNQIK